MKTTRQLNLILIYEVLVDSSMVVKSKFGMYGQNATVNLEIKGLGSKQLSQHIHNCIEDK
jgi:hypothetical protein